MVAPEEGTLGPVGGRGQLQVVADSLGSLCDGLGTFTIVDLSDRVELALTEK